MASGRLADYLGKGLAPERPASLDLHPEAVGFYYATDSEKWSAWDGARWLEDIMGGGGSPETLSIITEPSAFTASPTTHSGLSRYVRAGGDVTFSSGTAYSAGQVFNVRATAAIDLVGDGITLTTSYGGTLSMESGMAVTVVMTSGAAGDVIGQTVAA